MTPHSSPDTRNPQARRDPAFEREVADGFDRLVETFVAEGFRRKQARLWVGAWRHTDDAAVLARYAVSFHHLGVDAGRAVPWYWEHIPPTVAVRYLPYRWRAAEARRLMQRLRSRDASLTRQEALAIALRWAESYRSPDAALELVTLGYDVDTADRVEACLEQETVARHMADAPAPSSLRQWAEAGIPPSEVLRFLLVGVARVEEVVWPVGDPARAVVETK